MPAVLTATHARGATDKTSTDVPEGHRQQAQKLRAKNKGKKLVRTQGASLQAYWQGLLQFSSYQRQPRGPRPCCLPGNPIQHSSTTAAGPHTTAPQTPPPGRQHELRYPQIAALLPAAATQQQLQQPTAMNRPLFFTTPPAWPTAYTKPCWKCAPTACGPLFRGPNHHTATRCSAGSKHTGPAQV